MKNKLIPVICTLLILLCSCSAGSGEGGERFIPDAEYIQVVMFHLEQRCESCNAVEQVTKELLEEEYGRALDAGEVKFIPLGFRSENGRKAAGYLGATGQSLFVVKGDSISNLTPDAFVFATVNPQHYRNALKQELKEYLK